MTQLLSQLKGNTQSKDLLKQGDYISTLKSLQILSKEYETSAILGNLGLFTILLCQFNLETLLITQRSIESDAVDSQGHALHVAAKELITKSDENDVSFDEFVAKIVTLYQNDILPQIAPEEGAEAPQIVFKPPVLKLLRTTFEQFFQIVMSTELTPSSQLSILKLSSSIIDQYWSKCTAAEVKSGEVPVVGANENSVLVYALKLVVAYLATLKTDNSQRPPKFFPSRPIKSGLVDGNKDSGDDFKAKVEEINDFLTDFYVTGVLKLQEIFTGVSEEGTTSNLNVISAVEHINYLLYIIAYIANGTPAHCQLLLSLDFSPFETMHKWFNVVNASLKELGVKNQVALEKEKSEQIQNLVHLLEDFDAIIVLGNRERHW